MALSFPLLGLLALIGAVAAAKISPATTLPKCAKATVADGKFVCLRDFFDSKGWIVVQQRFDGSVDFNRTWAEYRNGFGEVGPNTEFWWGLEKLHQHTKDGKYELRIEFKDREGEEKYAGYRDFVVEGESKKYRLADLSGFHGTAGNINTMDVDEGMIPTGRKFTTWDSDNDDNPTGNCAEENGGGWWYGWCGTSPNSGTPTGGKWTDDMVWRKWIDILHYTRLSIRRK